MSRCCLAADFVLPTLLFSALGAMTWAVRGSSGFGASSGCLFAGVAWGGSKQPLRAQDWCLRIAAGIVAAALARLLFDHFPQIFLPLYDSMASQYADLKTNPNLRRLINDSRAAIQHLGLYLGFLGFE